MCWIFGLGGRGLYGIEAINANNGWAISVVGITIVFSGLVVLSLIISQLHKGLDLFDHPGKIKNWFIRPDKKQAAPSAPAAPTMEIQEGERICAAHFKLLVSTLGSPFSLPRLLDLATARGVDHPHTTLSLLLKSQVIHPDGNGFFCWDPERFSRTFSR
jgi:hypothetical protein